VAVVGDKRENGYMWLRSVSTFKGKVYSVQVDPRELAGIRELGVENYTSLLDIPDRVDYVIVAVPRSVAPRIVADCIQKQVGGVTLFTSGFAETNTEEGRRLQQTITDMAQQADLKLIGPNCMGIFNPKIGLRHSFHQYSGESGPAGFISQSGTHATLFSLVGALQGIKVSKSVSYGNAAVLDCIDYLEYLADDAETRIIGMYIEGTKEGQRLFRCLKEISGRKPVLIWKGGRDEEGVRAAASHTGSLTQSPVLWDALFRQCGVIRVDNLDEMIDTTKALLYIKPTTGRRVGLVAMSGGQSVVITDAFTAAGLTVPLLKESSYRELSSFFNPIGGSYLNPFDISWNIPSVEHLMKILNVLNQDENIDIIVLEISVFFLSLRWEPGSSFYDHLFDALAEFKLCIAKPFFTILIPGQMEVEAMEIREQLNRRGIPNFPSFERGARALSRMIQYHQFHSRRD
jgi:acyl-CoA synthetase (NDP forming)